MKLNWKSLTFVLVFMLSPFAAYSGPAEAPLSCADVLISRSNDALDESVHKSWPERRHAIIDFLNQHPEISAFRKQTATGSVPVILLNEQSFPLLRPLLNSSVGYGFEQRSDVDHGLLRIEDLIMDFGHMETRKGPPNTELNKNGIAWKKLKNTLPWRRIVIQNSYLMPKEDRDVARYYQLVRRASLFRTKFFFSEDRYLDRQTPNLLESLTEHCFQFCKTDQAHAMISEVDSELARLLGRPAADLLQSTTTLQFLKAVREKLLAADAFDPAQLNWKSTIQLSFNSGVQSLLPPTLNNLQREAVANLIVSRDALITYRALLDRYQISPDHGYADLHSASVSYVLIFDSPEKNSEFRKGNYEAHGSFFHWTREGQSPL